MVAFEGIKKTHLTMAECCIDKLINFGKRKGAFGVGLIQISEINIDPPFTLLFLDYHSVGQQLKIKNLIDGPSLFELITFLLYYFGMFLRRLLRLLPLRCFGWVHVEMMTYELQIYPRSLICSPRKNIQVIFQANQ